METEERQRLLKKTNRIKKALKDIFSIFDSKGTEKVGVRTFRDKISQGRICLSESDMKKLEEQFCEDGQIWYVEAIKRLQMKILNDREVWYFSSKDIPVAISTNETHESNNQNKSNGKLKITTPDENNESQAEQPVERVRSKSVPRNIYDQALNNTLKRLRDTTIDIRELQNVRNLFMNLDVERSGIVPLSKIVTGIKNQDLKTILVDYCSENDMFQLSKLNQIFDKFYYVPPNFKVFRNQQKYSNNLKNLIYPPNSPSPLRSKTELKIQVIKRIEAKYINIKAAFRAFDRNRDNRIDFDEFLAGVQELGILVQEEELQELFKQLDISNQNLLNYDSFASILEESLLSMPLGKQARQAAYNYSQQPGLQLNSSTLGRPAFIEDKNPEYISSNSQGALKNQFILQKRKKKSPIPSDRDDSFSYGQDKRHRDNMHDLIIQKFNRRDFIDKVQRVSARTPPPQKTSPLYSMSTISSSRRNEPEKSHLDLSSKRVYRAEQKGSVPILRNRSPNV